MEAQRGQQGKRAFTCCCRAYHFSKVRREYRKRRAIESVDQCDKAMWFVCEVKTAFRAGLICHFISKAFSRKQVKAPKFEKYQNDVKMTWILFMNDYSPGSLPPHLSSSFSATSSHYLSGCPCCRQEIALQESNRFVSILYEHLHHAG